MIKVSEGYDVPYFYRGWAYIRIGGANHMMTSTEIEQLIARKILERISSDSKPTNATLDGLMNKRLDGS